MIGNLPILIMKLLYTLAFLIFFAPLRSGAQLLPMKEVYGKKPMKIDSNFKATAVQLPVKRQGGFSSLLKYDYAEYTMQSVKHKPEVSKGGFGFLKFAGKEVKKTSFSYVLTNKLQDTARIFSALVFNNELSRSYYFFEGFGGTEIDKSTDIYTANLTLTGDTSHWEILVMDRMRFMQESKPEVIGTITNGPQRFLIRLVAEFENGEKAKLTVPGFEILRGGKVVMAVQYIGPPMKAPMIWLDPALDPATRFMLISAASALITRIDEVYGGERTGME